MRILHVTNAFPYSDVPEYGVFVKEQIAALNRAGIISEVLFVNARADGKSAYLKGIKECHARAPDFDIVHCHHLYSGFVAMLARVNKPVLISFQNDWLHEVEINNFLVKRALCSLGVSYADRLIFKSPIPRIFRGNPKFVHLPNGVNYDAFTITSQVDARKRLGLDLGARYALFVSSKDQFRPQKRYDRFSETLAMVRGRNPEMDLRELVMVNQPRDRVSDFFNAADVHLLCSDYEGSPNSVKEALCTGLPIVATPVGNTAEMVDGIPGCHIATDFDVVELARLLERSLGEPKSREMVRTGFVAKGLSQTAASEKLRELYAGMIHVAKPVRGIGA